jgi:hypothetical protein
MRKAAANTFSAGRTAAAGVKIDAEIPCPNAPAIFPPENASGTSTSPAVIRTYRDLVNHLIDRRHDLGLTQLDLDARAGWSSGYSGKLEAFDGSEGRVAGAVTLPLWLEALGVELLPVAAAPSTGTRPPRSVPELERRPRRLGVEGGSPHRREIRRAKVKVQSMIETGRMA